MALDVPPMGHMDGQYPSLLNPVGALPPSRATETVKVTLPAALKIEELPRAPTCGAYREHDPEAARAKIKRLASEKLVHTRTRYSPGGARV